MRAGPEIAAHTHPSLFREQSPERMLDEWRVTCDVLVQVLGEPCVSAVRSGRPFLNGWWISRMAAAQRDLNPRRGAPQPHRLGVRAAAGYS